MVSPQLCEALHAASRTAPELVPACAVDLEKSSSHRLEVGGHTCLGVLGGEYGVVVGILIEVHILAVVGYLEQLTGQLEHIVRVAGLTVAVGALSVKDIVLAEVLPFAVAACDVCVVSGYHVPEILCVSEIG